MTIAKVILCRLLFGHPNPDDRYSLWADPFNCMVVTFFMSTGPPFRPDDPNSSWEDWRDETIPLSYPGRDIRIIFPEQQRGTVHEPKYQPPDFGDFDPNPDDPDPDVWPLKGLDPGYPAKVEDLILIQNSFPAPHVAWVTEEFLEARYGYNPVRQQVDVKELPKWARPEKTSNDGTVEIIATADSELPMSLTDDRREALTRLARLWNGETVRSHHLLLDKCPDWMDIFGDLNQDELKRLVVDPNSDPFLAAAFGEYDWYEENQSVYMTPKRILRKKVWYAPTQRGRTLINKHPDFPDLHGDLNEGLVHRFTVGLTALREVCRERKVGTYYDLDGYKIDILSQDTDDQLYAGEVMTGHHNWELHRRTYEKLKELNNVGVTPYVIFDSRETAYEIFNHWHKRGLGHLPNGQFNSEFRISKGREQIQDAYENDQYDWIISDWATTAVLWRNTLGPDGPEIKPGRVTSYTW